MTAHDLLAALKFSLPAVAFASVILGQLKDVRREGADGDKHLTFYGRVLTALTVASAFVSLFAAGLEAILKKQDEAEAAQTAQKTAVENLAAAQVAQAEKAKERADAQAARDRDAKAAREVQTRLLDQKLAFLKEAAEAQRRDALISRQLAQASAARLTDAERSIAEFARINNPLRTVVAWVEMDLDLSGPDIDRWWSSLDAKRRVPFQTGAGAIDPNEQVQLTPDDLAAEKRLKAAANGTRLELCFYPPGAITTLALRSDDALALLDRINGQPEFAIRFKRPTLTADLNGRRVTALYELEDTPEHEGEFGGRKMSMDDVRRRTMVLQVTRYDGVAFRLSGRVHRVGVRLNDHLRFAAIEPAVRFKNFGAYALVLGRR